MKKKPIKVKLLGKKANSYQIKFPNLQVPVEVNETLYKKMLNSNEYLFKDSTTTSRVNSA